METPDYLPPNLDELGLDLKEISHEEAGERFAAYMARDQNLQERAELVKHIRGCPTCHEKFLQLNWPFVSR